MFSGSRVSWAGSMLQQMPSSTVPALADGGYACLGNAHVLVTALHDDRLRRALDEAWAVFPDGAPVAWMQRRHGRACGAEGRGARSHAEGDRGRPASRRSVTSCWGRTSQRSLVSGRGSSNATAGSESQVCTHPPGPRSRTTTRRSSRPRLPPSPKSCGAHSAPRDRSSGWQPREGACTCSGHRSRCVIRLSGRNKAASSALDATTRARVATPPAFRAEATCRHGTSGRTASSS